MTHIPFFALNREFENNKTEIENILRSVVASGYYILGEQVKSFEIEFANYLKAKHVIGVANGTDAITLALLASGIGKEDEVIVASHNPTAVVVGIERSGAVPVFADIERKTRCISPESIEELISEKTKAVLAVHLYGQSCSIEKIIEIAKRRKIIVVEDCSQCHGASVNSKKLGNFGDVSAFSFYPTKNLGAFGDAGAVVTNNDQIAEKVRLLRQYGWRTRYVSEIQGLNSRLDEIQAAVLRFKLSKLDLNIRRRNEIANLYIRHLKDLDLTLPKWNPNEETAIHLFVIESSRREILCSELSNNNIGYGIHYPLPIHQQPAYMGKYRCENLIETERLASQILSLPLYPELTDEEIICITDTIKVAIKLNL